MKLFFAAMFPRRRRLLESAACGALIVVILVSAPFLFDLVGRGIGWIIGLFPHPAVLWRECPWCF